MSFPDDFELPEEQSMTKIGKQIGNAVPPLLAQTLAETVAELLQNNSAGSRTEMRAA
jgi:site-specific DNA-cytosine methylase